MQSYYQYPVIIPKGHTAVCLCYSILIIYGVSLGKYILSCRDFPCHCYVCTVSLWSLITGLFHKGGTEVRVLVCPHEKTLYVFIKIMLIHFSWLKPESLSLFLRVDSAGQRQMSD